MKKKLLVLFTAAAFLVSFGFDHEGVAFAQAPPKGALPGQLSESAFKNVTVLKGIPVDEFMGTMGLFAAALSFCCKDCHTGAGTSNPKWEDDPPRKVTARRMIQMVKNLNQQSFNGRQVVTCWTCHRGSPSPAITPPIDTIYGDAVFTPTDVLPAANPTTGGTPPADQILDKYIQALGGADALSKITSFTAKGSSHLFGEVQEDPTEISAKAPNLLVTVVHQREGDVARTFDGREAWVMLPLTVVGQYPLNGSMLDWSQAGCAARVSRRPQAVLHELARQLSECSQWNAGLRRSRHRRQWICRDVLFRQEDRPPDANGPLYHVGGGACSDANRLLGLPAGKRRHDAVQMDLRMDQRAGRVHAHADPGECPG